MITLKEYAAAKKISYEAVRKQVKRYRDELGEHIIQDGRQQFLDDYATAFLNEKRIKNPVILEQAEKNEQIEELERSNKNLLIKVAEQADRIAALAEWKSENAVAIADMKQQQLMIEEKTKEINELQKNLEEACRKIEELQKENEAALKQAASELEAERNKKLTLKERILGKRLF